MPWRAALRPHFTAADLLHAAPPPFDLVGEELEDVVAHGLTPDDARLQLALLASPPPPIVLERAATVGDGILRLTPHRAPTLLARWAAAADAGRLGKVIPASGGATRMFEALLALRNAGETSRDALADRAAAEPWAAQALRFYDARQAFAVWRPLAAELARRGLDPHVASPWQVASALLDADGLDAARLPKALVPFHPTPRGIPLAAHVDEAVATVRDQDGVVRIHFTVPAPHREACAHAIAAVADGCAAHGVQLEASLSVQAPHTDALAVTPEGRPFRTDAGELLFRPGGHGALLANLEASGLDVVHVKNVDNVLPPGSPAQAVELATTCLLFGLALELEAAVRIHLDALDRDGTLDTLDGAARFLAEDLNVAVPRLGDADARRGWLIDRLRRPLRVCGVVRNDGEAGGGPFWVRGADGVTSLQIVEGAQVARTPEQRAILAAATHFNPVDMVCLLRDPDGAPHALARWVDPATTFVVEKSSEGRPLRAIERPGLWNGAMAGWNTVLIEIPRACFAPVKTILDLLRPEHRASVLPPATSTR